MPLSSGGSGGAPHWLGALPAALRAAEVPALVDRLLDEAADAGASDLHFLPLADGLSVSWRLDGVLQTLGVVPQSVAANVAARPQMRQPGFKGRMLKGNAEQRCPRPSRTSASKALESFSQPVGVMSVLLSSMESL